MLSMVLLSNRGHLFVHVLVVVLGLMELVVMQFSVINLYCCSFSVLSSFCPL